MMDLLRLIDDLQLDDKVQALPSTTLPPITALLSKLQRRLIDRPPEPGVLIDGVASFFRAADHHWLFDADAEGVVSAYVSVVRALIGCASLPPYDRAQGAPPEHYANAPILATGACAALQALLRKADVAGQDERALAVTMAVAPHVFVYTVTHAQEQPWTSVPSRQAARRLQSLLFQAGGWRDSAHMLTGEYGGEGLLGAVLDVLQPQLTREAWQWCDEVKFVFAWTLFQVPRPFLAPHLPRLLGPALLLSDHHEADKSTLGVGCLHHIVSNTAASELRALNRAHVMYDALFKHLYGTHAGVIQLSLRCLLDLLPVLESPPASVAAPPAPRRACRHDDVLRLLLTHMEAEHKVALRRVYAQELPAYLQKCVCIPLEWACACVATLVVSLAFCQLTWRSATAPKRSRESTCCGPSRSS
ncbi:TELO2-interacting protein 2 isoform X2 [Corythoichthys intestinalis]|uniref:TELO2-interacting protein 2 isoform X2 n=1 Tax=Corythoichthys intestinalis TaxID=161448 RepID=UPI0025A65A5F|nr:TELO2-interacting protein 2 isoform X2 [Corythoichthys intestinalis]